MMVADWGPDVRGIRGLSPSSENCDLTAQNNAFFFDFYIIETLYIPITTIKSEHAIEVSMVN
jgi:hypothetical protein